MGKPIAARWDRPARVNLWRRRGRIWGWLVLLGLVLGMPGCASWNLWWQPEPTEPWLTPTELAVIVNQADPLSGQIAAYYQQQRQIPERNMISVNFTPVRPELSPAEFAQLQQAIAKQLPAYIRAFVLTWAAPYRVGCMSITTAFALGFDPAFCAQGCQPTRASPYFNSDSPQPPQTIRPTMAIAATTFAQAQALIDRGVAADASNPTGTAYLVSTSDRRRNVRAGFYPNVVAALALRFTIHRVDNDALRDKADVMFYFTGLPQVEHLQTNHFLPGAIADHLTSLGGMLTDSPQMSSLRWLEAGATGSYGAVAEPCNFPAKFPNPGVAMAHYLNGDTLIEAYWKSVAWPGQGIFIGEPLARPFGRPRSGR